MADLPEMPMDDPRVQKALRAKAMAAPALRSFPNVIGVGVGFKVVKGVLTDQVCVRVYVRRKVPPDELGPGQIVPAIVGGVPTDVIEREFRRLQLDVAAAAIGSQGRHPVLFGGISGGNWPREITGTLGTLVFDNLSKRDMILSNWHVFCGASSCVVGEIISQPGRRRDGGLRVDIIARLERSAHTDRVDAAVAWVSGHRFMLKRNLGIGRIAGTRAPALGIIVRKSGRSSGVTSGTITDVTANLTIENFDYRDQVMVEGPDVAMPGDSGSVLVDAARRVVGLVFAGPLESPFDYVLANPIAPVLQALDINVDGGVTQQDFIAAAFC